MRLTNCDVAASAIGVSFLALFGGIRRFKSLVLRAIRFCATVGSVIFSLTVGMLRHVYLEAQNPGAVSRYGY